LIATCSWCRQFVLNCRHHGNIISKNNKSQDSLDRKFEIYPETWQSVSDFGEARSSANCGLREFLDLSDRSDLSDPASPEGSAVASGAGTGLMTREDWKITFPKSRVCVRPVRSPFPPFSLFSPFEFAEVPALCPIPLFSGCAAGLRLAT